LVLAAETLRRPVDRDPVLTNRPRYFVIVARVAGPAMNSIAGGAPKDASGLTQLAMFADDESRPAGLRYAPSFVSPDEEADLIDHIRALPLAPFVFGIFEGKRRVVFFGSRYDFKHQRLDTAEALPPWLDAFARRVEGVAGLPSGGIEHALCTEYEIGAGIGWHRDKKYFAQIFGLSLGAACGLRFRRKAGGKWQRFTLDAQPRSLYAMAGDARHVWQHSIPPVEALRYSVTFRTMAQA
jgi:alkylated DNA repair dioxygenase AlkB